MTLYTPRGTIVSIGRGMLRAADTPHIVADANATLAQLATQNRRARAGTLGASRHTHRTHTMYDGIVRRLPTIRLPIAGATSDTASVPARRRRLSGVATRVSTVYRGKLVVLRWAVAWCDMCAPGE